VCCDISKKFFNCQCAEISRRKGEKGKKTTSSPVVDHSFLASNYYGSIVAGLAFVDDFSSVYGMFTDLALA
jgi:hypothetical protein